MNSKSLSTILSQVAGLCILAITALVIAIPSGDAFAAPKPPKVKGTPSYSINISTHSETNLDVQLFGYATGTSYAGSSASQYKFHIDWGDGETTTEQPLQNTTDDDVDFDAEWSGSHTYDVEGDYDIEVTLYHNNLAGNEKASASLEVTLDDGITPPPAMGTITVTKMVEGGELAAASFALFMDSMSITTGVPTTTVAGVHTITETPVEGYTASFSETCPLGVINLLADASVECTITNTFNEEPLEDVTVTIVKFIDGVHATAETASNASFAMSATWDAENIGAGTGQYALSNVGFNTPNAYEAVTADMTNGADYSTYEILNSTVGESCEGDEPFALVGYTFGNSLEDAADDEPSSEAPSFVNITSDKFVIVWNEDCTPAPVPTGTITVTKVVVGSDDEASSFDLFLDGMDIDSGIATTTVVGQHVVTEESVDNYIASYSESCEAGVIDLSEGEEVSCTITNTYTEDAPTVGGLIVQKNVLLSDGESEVSDNTSFTIDLNGAATTTVSESSEAHFYALEPGMYTITESDATGYDFVSFNPSGTVSVTAGATTTIFITNKVEVDPEPTGPNGAVVVTKDVIGPDDETEYADGSFFTVWLGETGSVEISEVFEGTFYNVTPGMYMLYEVPKEGYEAVTGNPMLIEVVAGATTTVEFVNRSLIEEPAEESTGRLIVFKEVVNEGGFVLDDETRFRVTLNGDDSEVFSTDDPAIWPTLAPGYYTLVEEAYEGYESSISTSTFQITADSVTRITVTNTDIGSGDSEGSSSRRGSRHRSTGGNGGGEVLGASTDTICAAGIGSYMRLGDSSDDVLKLQSFLNEHLGTNIPLTGYFGPQTLAAVHQLQKMYGQEILQPWVDLGLLPSDKESTGYVYKMTLWWINQSLCASAEVAEPQLP